MNADLFWAKVEGTPACWLWTGSTNDAGYGTLGVDGKMRLAHRVAYEMVNGPIPDGLVVDHVYERGCRSTSCVRPDHLEAVTVAENNRRSRAARGYSAPRPGEVPYRLVNKAFEGLIDALFRPPATCHSCGQVIPEKRSPSRGRPLVPASP